MAAGRNRVKTLCRDCGAFGTALNPSERCEGCGSPRLVRHAELASLAVAHVDCDAFYATVEKRDRPELADRSRLGEDSVRFGRALPRDKSGG
jgi:DNA polymerase-4